MSPIAHRLRAFPTVSKSSLHGITDARVLSALQEAAHLIASAADVTGAQLAIRSDLLRECVQDIQHCWERADKFDDAK